MPIHDRADRADRDGRDDDRDDDRNEDVRQRLRSIEATLLEMKRDIEAIKKSACNMDRHISFVEVFTRPFHRAYQQLL